MLRRDFFRSALALPFAGLFAPFERLTAADLGKVRITDVKMRPSSSHTMIRIDTDAGISGFGESGVTMSMMKAWMEVYKPLLVKQDPLAIQYHWHRMSTLMHTYMSRIPALSGIDMALWDLAGRLTGLPVYRLLGGPFREKVPFFINTEPRNMLDKAAVKAWADQFKANPLGFRGAKINTHSVFGVPMGRYTTSLSTQDLHKLRTSFENVRQELGFDYDIMVHCHNEYDLPSAKAMARAVEGIEPKWFEDPLQPQFSDNWVALKRECRVPLSDRREVRDAARILSVPEGTGGGLHLPGHRVLRWDHGLHEDRQSGGDLPHPRGDAQRGRHLADDVLHPRGPLDHGLPHQ